MTKMIDKIIENMEFFMTYLSPFLPQIELINNNAVIIKTKDFKDDTFNYVLKTNFTTSPNDQIDEISSIFLKDNLPFSWWVGPKDTPSNLSSLLLSKGYHLKEQDYGMYLRLPTYSFNISSSLKIKKVKNTESLKHFSTIFTSLGGNKNTYDEIYSHLPIRAYGENAPYEFYIGYIDNEPITTGIIVFHKNIAGIYFIMTRPEKRKKGYGMAMMQHLINRAIEKQVSTIVLQASEMGKRLYQKIGFSECCIFNEYSL